MIMKRLTQILAIAFVSIATPCTAFAQNNFIVCGIPDLDRDTYNDINDTTIQPYHVKSGSWYNRYNFDMDGNGGLDVKIRTTEWENAGGGGNNTQLLYLTNNIKFAFGEQLVDTIYYFNPPQIQYYNFPKTFNYNDTIDSRYNFLQSDMFLAVIGGPGFYFIYHPGWLNLGEKYIGISMEKNDVMLYGYILVEVTGYSRVIIKEFAMNINPYVGIEPGKTNQVFEMYPNPASNEVFIKQSNQNTGNPAVFSLYDISGKMVFQATSVPEDGHIALPALAKGLYVAEFEVDGQRYSKKLAIE